MTKQKHSFICLLIVVLLSFNFCFSQNSTVLLKDKLSEIEMTKGVMFNYASMLLENVYVSNLKKGLSLKEMFEIYTRESGLGFEFIDDKRIVIKKNYEVLLQFVDTNDQQQNITNVVIKDTASNQVWHSNKFGKVFFVKASVPLEIMISHPRYQTTVVALSENKNITLTLEPKVRVLDLVHLKTYLTSGILQSTSGNFIAKPRKNSELPGLVTHDVMRSLQNLPHLNASDESITNFSVRGGTNDQNQLLWNGIKMYQNSHFFGLISSFNYNLVNYISLYDNATPARMGGSTSSIIKIDSKNHLSKKLKGGVGASLISTDFYNYIPVGKKSNILISGRRGLTDVYRSPTYKSYSKKAFQNSNLDIETNNSSDVLKGDHFLFYDVELHYLLNYNEKNKFRFRSIYFKNELSHLQAIISQDEARESFLNQRSYGVGLSWDRKFSERFKGKLSYSLSDYDLFAENRTYVFNLNNEQGNKITSHQFDLDFYHHLKHKQVLQFGGSYEHLAVTNFIQNNVPSFNSLILDINESASVYAQLNRNDEKLSYAAGVRAVYYNKVDELHIEPRAFVKYALTDAVTVRIRGEMKSQYLSQDVDYENNFLGVEKRRWHLANDSIYKVQTSKQVDIGVGYRKDKGLSVYATAYLKQVKNINTFGQGFKNLNLFENHFGAYNAKGVNIHTNMSRSGKTLWASYTYALNDYDFETLTPSKFRNNLDVRHRLVLGSKIDIKPFSIAFGMEYKTGAPYTGINEANPIIQDGVVSRINYDLLNQKELPDYLRFDASLMYNFNLSKSVKSKITLGIINLTDKKNIVNRIYQINGADSANYSEINLSGLRFAPNISLRIDY